MKNNVKKMSLFIAALTVSSVLASSVSAGNIMHPRNDNEDELRYPVCNSVLEDDECDGVKTEAVKSSGNTSAFVWKSGDTTVYTKNPVKKSTCNSSIFAQSNVKPPKKYDYCDIIGGKYYSASDAKKELEKYFDDNSYDMYFQKGDERIFCKDAYYYSTDTDVVYFNYKTGKLVAKAVGSADVYVYTSGGVPIFRLDVTVDRSFDAKGSPVLDVVPEDWRLEVGETTTFEIRASNGKVYDDIKYTIREGSDNARITTKGKLTAKRNGAVVVYAYSESNTNIYGEALVYIGSYTNAVKDGCWTKCDGGIRVDKWDNDIRDFYCSKVNGWIKSEDGIFIPVLKLEEVTIVDENGNVGETTILTSGQVSLYDLLKDAYGNKDEVVEIIKKYNLLKYGVSFDKKHFVYDDIDMKNFVLSQLIKDFID